MVQEDRKGIGRGALWDDNTLTEFKEEEEEE